MNTKVLIVFSLVALIFISCGKDEETLAVKNGSAKITGVAKCQLDLTTNEKEYAPVGTKIIAIINTEDLVNSPDNNITYPDRAYTTTVGENGSYSLTIEANAKTVSVDISASDFEYNQVQADTITRVRKIYSYAPSTVTVIDGISKIQDIDFNDN